MLELTASKPVLGDGDNSPGQVFVAWHTVNGTAAIKTGSAAETTASAYQGLTVESGPRLVLPPAYRPTASAAANQRRLPLLVAANRLLGTILIAVCGIALVGYGLDVAFSSQVGSLQQQARRLAEQNTELSAQLLKVISFQGIQDSALGRFGLRVPDQVAMVDAVDAGPLPEFKRRRTFLPLMAGY